MVRPAALGLLVHPATLLRAAVRAIAAALGRGPLGRLDVLDDRMLRDIGLTRQDVLGHGAEPLFRAPALWRAGGREAPAAARATARFRRSHAALTRLWAEDRRTA